MAIGRAKKQYRCRRSPMEFDEGTRYWDPIRTWVTWVSDNHREMFYLSSA